MRPPERIIVSTLALLLSAAIIAGCGAAAARTAKQPTTPVVRLTGGGGASTSTSPSAPSRAQLQALPALTTGPLVRVLSRKLRAALHPLGTHTGVLVTDLSTDKSLYALRAAVRRPPASVEKIYTTVALLDLMGPDARLRTSVMGSGRLAKHGVWTGNLYLVGGGDPTFGDGYWNKVDEGGYGPTAGELATQLHKLGIRRVTGRIYGDESLFDAERGGPATDGKPDTPDYDGELSALVYDHGMTSKHLTPPEFAARELALTMKLQGIKVTASPRTKNAPKAARQLAKVLSPPLRVLVRLMDVPSDDLFADLFAKQLGARFFGQGTLAGGAIEVRQLLAARYGITPQIHDGSGLDHADRTSPDQVVSLLRQIRSRPVGQQLSDALPIVGREGTVAGIGEHTYAAGRCVAKTGTLNNVTNLAGYCRTRSSNVVAFAIFVDGPSNWQAITGLSKAIGAIADY